MKASQIFSAIFVLALIATAYIQIIGVCPEYSVMRVRNFACGFIPPAIAITGFVSLIASLFLAENEKKN